MPIIRLKRGTKSQVQGATLQIAEPAFATDTNELVIQGTTAKTTFHPVKTDLVSSNITLTFTHHTVLVDASGGSRTITLPSAGICNGREFVIRKIDTSTNTVVITPQSGQTIDGQSSITLHLPNIVAKLRSDGSNWRTVQSYRGPLPRFVVSVSPTSITLYPNLSTNLTLTVTPYDNFTGNVGVFICGLHPTVTVSPSTISITDANPKSQIITLTASSSTPVGTYDVVVTVMPL